MKNNTAHNLSFAAAFLLLLAGGANAAESLNIVGYGGQYGKIQSAVAIKPFAQKSGIQINQLDYTGGLAEIRVQVESKKVIWDVMAVRQDQLERGCREGLFEQFDAKLLQPGADGTPAAQDFMPGTLFECGVGAVVFSTVIAYNTAKFPGGAPKTVADFFDTKKFPGRRGLSKYPNGIIEWALMADGVPPADVYKTLSTPDGVARAFRKLDTIKKDAVFWGASAQQVQLLADGEVTMSAAYNGRIFAAITREKQPMGIVWDGQVWSVDCYAIPRGAKNQDLGRKFIQFATQSDVLPGFANALAYGPVRKSAMAGVKPAVMPFLPNAPENVAHGLKLDVNWWSDHAAEMNERYSTWMNK